MHLLSADRITASIEGRTLFADASFGLSSADRVGVVGPNGSGKTTLLRIVAGDRAPDAGRVVARSGLRVGWLGQAPTLPDAPALDVVVAGDPAARDDEAAALCARVGIDAAQPTTTMSGGQRRRVGLARTLLAPSDLLVLDEPTNHLDVDTIDWLEGELRRRGCGLVVVTHDRYVLERLVNRMVDLAPRGPDAPADSGAPRARGDVIWHEGSYSSLLEARAARAERRERATTRARNLLRKEVAWLQRGPKARTSKPRFRVEQVETLAAAAAGDPEAAPLELGTGRTRLGNDVFALDDVTVVRGERTVLDAVTTGIGPGERVGVVGPNGAGKTTLLDVLAGRLEPSTGRVSVGATVRLGRYAQGSAEDLDLDETVLDSVLAIAEHVPLASGETLPAHRLAERFGFDGRLQRTTIRLLSGGERRRVALLHLLVAAPNVLLLDEPTNDLDLDTLTTLEDHLDGFAGTLVVASHDRYVLDRLTDRTLAIAAGDVTEHLDWASYRDARTASEQQRERVSTPRSTTPASANDNRARQAARRRARSLQGRIDKLTEERAGLHTAMATAATEPDRLRALQSRADQVDAELHEAEHDWLELTVSP